MVTWKGESQPAKKFSFPIFLFLNQVASLLPGRPFYGRHPNLGFRHLIPTAIRRAIA